MKEHSAHHPSPIYWPGRLSALLPLALFIGATLKVPEIQKNGAMAMAFDWVPSLNVRFDVVLDGLSLLFVLIITGIGFLVTIYADAYLAGHRQINRFFVYLQSFLLSMVGLVLSNNLILLFVFWELTTLFSFLLIGFQNESATARDSARQALLVTGGGGLLLLVGITLVLAVAGFTQTWTLGVIGERIVARLRAQLARIAPARVLRGPGCWSDGPGLIAALTRRPTSR